MAQLLVPLIEARVAISLHFSTTGLIQAEIPLVGLVPLECQLLRAPILIMPLRPVYTVYECRSAAPWEGDIALSVTCFPHSLSTYAILFGSNDEISQAILERLERSDEKYYHPMILPTIFAEIERDRQIGLVHDSISESMQRITDIDLSDLNKLGHEPNQAPRVLPVEKKDSIAMWVEISQLRNGLKSFQRQMEKMASHVQELSDTLFRSNPDGLKSVETERFSEDDTIKQRLRESGLRIGNRLQELIDEYDENLRHCDVIIDGMKIATQLVRIYPSPVLSHSMLTMHRNGIKLGAMMRL
jgi:hypothetical protein